MTLGNGRVVTYSYEADSALDELVHRDLVSGADAAWSFDDNMANQVTLCSISQPQFARDPGANLAGSATPNGQGA